MTRIGSGADAAGGIRDQLPDDTLLVFLADTHIGGTAGSDIFQSAAELTLLLEDLDRHQGPVELVLAGDFLDLLRMEDAVGTRDRVAATIGRPEYRELFAALRAFARGPGHRVVYLVGNHDAEGSVDGSPVSYLEQGTGTPVLALHGVDVDHREMAASLEPVFADRTGYRRLYPDLPGMGRTPAPESVNSTDDVLEVLLGLVDGVIGEQAFLVVGQSYGGYLARAIANRRPSQPAGLAVICSLGGGQARDEGRPEHVVLHASGGLEGVLDPAMDAEFRNYLVVQTPAQP